MSARQIVLCFDGTGNTFRTDGTDTNVLKICRMLEKSDEQLCYYQPGIGTDITPGSLASTTIQKKGRLDNSKALNLALGRSFDRHVLGGYRFLMRHYQAGAKVYIFGFSRGAYTARFLNEMLDYVGLLGPDNEEVVPFIWDAFVSWKLSRTDNDREEKRKAFRVMKDSREILSRPMARVHFLGMFDAVNSIADFEVNVDGRPSSKVVRHAVSIDERRIKFRPVLLWSHKDEWVRKTPSDEKKPEKETSINDSEHTSGPPVLPEIPNVSVPSKKQDIEADDNDEDTQDIEEVWFPGGHADIGGGWNLGSNEAWPLTHAPLVWMVQEARRAGLRLDPSKLKQHECIEEFDDDFDVKNASNSKRNVSSSELSITHNKYLEALQLAGTRGHIHDLLAYGNGLRLTSVLSWRLMEYLPLRRIELQTDGALKAVRWPPPRGRSRDIPVNAQIHVSAIQRMKSDPSYRPDNLIFGSSEQRGDTSGAGGIWNWVAHSHEGDPVRESDNYHPKTWLLNPINVFLADIWTPYLRPKSLASRAEDWVSKLLDMEDANSDYADLASVNAPMNLLVCYIRDGPDSYSVRRHRERMEEFLWVNKEGMFVNGTNGVQCWDTAFLIQAVSAAGLAEDVNWRSMLTRGLEFLDRQQIRENCKNQGVCYRHFRKGAWAFSNRDQGYGVSDCISEALKAVILLQKEADGYPQLLEDERIFDAVDTLLTYQNSSGGCASYEPTRGSEYLEMLNTAEVFGRIMIEYDYPECTSAVLTALTLFLKYWPGYRRTEIQAFIQRGVNYIKKAQRPDGRWYGSWGVCFTYGTMFGLECLGSVGENYANSISVRKGCEFLLSKQRENGGWSESFQSCEQMKYIEHPTGSQVVQTAFAIIALLSVDYLNYEPIAHGIRLIMSRQQANGEWLQEGIEGIFNKSCAISYPNYKFIFTTLALGKFAKKYPNFK